MMFRFLLCLFSVSLAFSGANAADDFSCDNFDANYSFVRAYDAFTKANPWTSGSAARQRRETIYRGFMRSFFQQLDNRTSNVNTVSDYVNLVETSFEAAANGSTADFRRIGITPKLGFSSFSRNQAELEFNAAQLAGQNLSSNSAIQQLFSPAQGAYDSGIQTYIKFERNARDYNYRTVGAELGAYQSGLSFNSDISLLNPARTNDRPTHRLANSSTQVSMPNLRYLTCKFAQTGNGSGGTGTESDS